MTMNAGIARALRRFAGMSVMAVVLLAGMHEVLYADPQLPLRSVDRVRMRAGDASNEIVDTAAVARIVELARAHGRERMRQARELCFVNVSTLEFFQDDRAVAHVLWEGDALIYEERRQTIIVRLTRAEAAELGRLLGGAVE